tara:strand:- start:2010 stop:2183 length:174 start_codon:yes stop_codon:yes gene_type:complete
MISNNFLLILAIIIFLLFVIGLSLTVYEFYYYIENGIKKDKRKTRKKNLFRKKINKK